ncbi:hypothetical protein BESB_066910 [Besnoitia besnoiti]|uniref:Transmembrane protein n=1 Tax=Besnoitia besnoiti TaxID=94643 RepID=A0A2A9M853_BESBE|nr:hypothetical protein BESB_066910 [Besnoitia besnoiti]PFH34658.1 hypothetical protein BESB_066910 [Besnoitia besnoiti]
MNDQAGPRKNQACALNRHPSLPPAASNATSFVGGDLPLAPSRVCSNPERKRLDATCNANDLKARRQRKRTVLRGLAGCLLVLLLALALAASIFLVVVLDFFAYSNHGKPLRLVNLQFTQPLRLSYTDASEQLEISLDGLHVRLEGSNPLLLPLNVKLGKVSLFFRPSPTAYRVVSSQLTRTANPVLFPPQRHHRRRRLSGEDFNSRHDDLFFAEAVTRSRKSPRALTDRRLFTKPAETENSGHNADDVERIFYEALSATPHRKLSESSDAGATVDRQGGAPAPGHDGIPPELWRTPYIPGRQLQPNRVNSVAMNRGAREVLAIGGGTRGWEVPSSAPDGDLLENPLLVQDMLDSLSPGRSSIEPGRSGQFAESLGRNPPVRGEKPEALPKDFFTQYLDGSAPSSAMPIKNFHSSSYLQLSNATACIPPSKEVGEDSDGSSCESPWRELEETQTQSRQHNDTFPAPVDHTIPPRSSSEIPLEIFRRRFCSLDPTAMTAALEVMVTCLNEGFAQIRIQVSGTQLAFAKGMFSAELDTLHFEPLFIPCEYRNQIQMKAQGQN